MSDSFPTGWPVRCPSCDSWNFYYVNDRTGTIRRYICKKCGDTYLATWKKGPRHIVFNEPMNTKMEDWYWAKVITIPMLSGPNQNGDDFSKAYSESRVVEMEVPELCDGTPAGIQKVLWITEGVDGCKVGLNRCVDV